MTDPAPVLRREVYALIETQIATLKQTTPSSELELAQFRVQSEKIRALFQAVDLSRSLLENRFADAMSPRQAMILA